MHGGRDDSTVKLSVHRRRESKRKLRTRGKRAAVGTRGMEKKTRKGLKKKLKSQSAIRRSDDETEQQKVKKSGKREGALGLDRGSPKKKKTQQEAREKRKKKKKIEIK